MAYEHNYIARENGKLVRREFAITSGGAEDAGKAVMLNNEGRLDASMLPEGVGQTLLEALAAVALAAGQFVTLYNDEGVLKARLADASVPFYDAHGWVVDDVEGDETASIRPLGTTNDKLSGLTIGADYWLGEAGAVSLVPPEDASGDGSFGVSQYLGVAKSATELLTGHYLPVYPDELPHDTAPALPNTTE